MNCFPMCPECAAEYADPLDRRFHAQPDACFDCGPHITWREASVGGEPGEAAALPAVGTTREASDAIIERCIELLAGGGIVAIKGLGGFHLACDASNEQAVAELRRRKRRSNKPLAVMVRDLADVNACAMSTTLSAACWPAAFAPLCCCADVLFARAAAPPTPRARAVRRARPSRARRYAPLHPASASVACRSRSPRCACTRHDQRKPERRAHRDR